MNDYEIRALDESTWPAFARLVEANGGIFGGCWCMGLHQAGAGRGTPDTQYLEIGQPDVP